jgi:type II secretory pathway pseudopilin PulG
MAAGRRLRDEQGETLLELVVAIVVLGTCVVAIGAGITVSIKISDIHRKQAIAQEFLHNYAEAVQNSYSDCTGGSPPSYISSLPAPNNGGSWTILQPSFQHWNGTSFVSGCPANTPADPNLGLQQVTLELKSRDGFVDESLAVVIRKTT